MYCVGRWYPSVVVIKCWVIHSFLTILVLPSHMNKTLFQSSKSCFDSLQQWSIIFLYRVVSESQQARLGCQVKLEEWQASVSVVVSFKTSISDLSMITLELERAPESCNSYISLSRKVIAICVCRAYVPLHPMQTPWMFWLRLILQRPTAWVPKRNPAWIHL